jgi:lipoyl(octanoyl) transferase
MDELWVCHLGQVEYRAAMALQERLRERVIAGELPDVMLLLEHPPVYTLGRRSRPEELPLGQGLGIDVVRTRRGGKLTYHGPGQLVGYPIVRVTDVPAYVARMQDAIVAALGEAGVEAHTREGVQYTGVWTGDRTGAPHGREPVAGGRTGAPHGREPVAGGRTGAPHGREPVAGGRKIASIGVHVSRGVSIHGFAINVDNDLAPFTWAVACGLPDVEMTSLAAEGGTEGLTCFRKRMAYRFAEALGRRQQLVSLQRLGEDVREPVPAPDSARTPAPVVA